MDHRPPPHRNDTPPRINAPSSARDPRIHGRSVFDSEQLRNPRPPPSTAEEKLMEFQSEFQRSQAALIGMMQSMQASMQLMLEKLDRRSERSRSPDSHHRREDVLHHQEIPEASRLPVGGLKQSKIKSTEIVTPTPIVRDPLEQIDSPSQIKQGISEMSINSTSKTVSSIVDEVSVQQIQEIQESAADQVFVEMPQPTSQAADDDSHGSKSQKPETSPESTHLSKVFGIQKVHIQNLNEFKVHNRKSNEFEIDYHNMLEMNWCVKNVQECAIEFPIIDIKEWSYVVEVSSKLEFVNVTMVAAQLFQVIRMDGEEMERLGVG